MKKINRQMLKGVVSLLGRRFALTESSIRFWLIYATSKKSELVQTGVRTGPNRLLAYLELRTLVESIWSHEFLLSAVSARFTQAQRFEVILKILSTKLFVTNIRVTWYTDMTYLIITLCKFSFFNNTWIEAIHEFFFLKNNFTRYVIKNSTQP